MNRSTWRDYKFGIRSLHFNPGVPSRILSKRACQHGSRITRLGVAVHEVGHNQAVKPSHSGFRLTAVEAERCVMVPFSVCSRFNPWILHYSSSAPSNRVARPREMRAQSQRLPRRLQDFKAFWILKISGTGIFAEQKAHVGNSKAPPHCPKQLQSLHKQ